MSRADDRRRRCFKELMSDLRFQDGSRATVVTGDGAAVDWLTYQDQPVFAAPRRPWPPETLVQPVGPPPPTPPVTSVFTSPDGDHVITPETGKLTLEGYPAEFRVIRRPVAPPPAPTVLSWLDVAAAFIPKSTREPFFGDLREVLIERRTAGWSNRWLAWVAVSQVAILFGQWFLTRRR